MRGDRRHPYRPHLYSNVGLACARANVVGVVISYRLAPAVTVMEQVRDVRRALEWTHKEVGRFGGDPGRIFLGGVSAGAHLCATLLTEERSEIKNKGVQGFVGLSGVYNIERLWRLGGGGGGEGEGERGGEGGGRGGLGLSSMMIPMIFGDDETNWPRASPVHAIRRARRRREEGGEAGSGGSSAALELVPLLLLNAERDFHLNEDTEELLKELRGGREGGDVERARAVVPGTDHLSLVEGLGAKRGKEEEGREGERSVLEDLVFSFIHRHA